MAEVAKSNLFTTTNLPNLTGTSIVIVRTEWNEAIVSALEKGCREVLDQAGAPYRVITAPGGNNCAGRLRDPFHHPGFLGCP
jgi:6,7-dimethyl-8-ribityllumazine synthase